MHIIFVDHSIKRHTFFVRSKHLGLEYRKFLHEFHLVLRHHSFNDLCFLLSANSINPPILVGSLHFLLGTQGAMFYNFKINIMSLKGVQHIRLMTCRQISYGNWHDIRTIISAGAYAPYNLCLYVLHGIPCSPKYLHWCPIGDISYVW